MNLIKSGEVAPADEGSWLAKFVAKASAGMDSSAAGRALEVRKRLHKH
eukprot:SAG11_NODE_30952_length_296_cov_0.730964_1_plen_47_part_10